MSNVGTAAAGKTLIGAGNGKSPTYANIGTNSGLTAHGVVVAEGNSAFTVATPGTSGYVLTSNGAGSDPTFQNITSTGAATTITGNSGGALSPTAGNWDILTANSTPKFVGSGSTLTQDFSIANLVLGSSLPSLSVGTANVGMGPTIMGTLTSGSQNVAIGNLAFQSVTSAADCVIIGYGAGKFITQGGANTFIGSGCGALTTISILNTAIGQGALGTYTTGGDGSGSNACLGASSLAALTTGINNTACGTDSLSVITTGFYNIAMGYGAGRSHTVADSSNIDIGNSGTVGDSNVTRIGTQGSGSGQQNKCFIAGVTGVTVAASAPVGINSSGQLNSLGFGTSGQALVSGGAGVSPSWSDITTLGTITTGVWNGTDIALADGGTNASLTASNGGIFYSTASAGAILAGTATAGQILRSGASTTPSWSTATYPATAGTSGNVLTSDGTNWTSAAPAGGFTTVTGTLTSAQIKALNATPQTLIAAPGAGQVIVIIAASAKFTYGGSNVFVAGAGQSINLSYGVTSISAINATNWLTNANIVGTTNRWSNWSGNLTTSYAAVSNVAIVAYNPVATEITGNAANNNTVPWSITYFTLTI